MTENTQEATRAVGQHLVDLVNFMEDTGAQNAIDGALLLHGEECVVLLNVGGLIYKAKIEFLSETVR